MHTMHVLSLRIGLRQFALLRDATARKRTTLQHINTTVCDYLSPEPSSISILFASLAQINCSNKQTMHRGCPDSLVFLTWTSMIFLPLPSPWLKQQPRRWGDYTHPFNWMTKFLWKNRLWTTSFGYHDMSQSLRECRCFTMQHNRPYCLAHSSSIEPGSSKCM